ncbi:MAG: MMPL family transporter [Saprospiraceae bacterium]|nr:MMPL family transporter [Saprospiraceae bacterium]
MLLFRRIVFSIFAVFIILSAYFTTKLRFSFDFEQFFPQGDADLEFFQDFIKNFETDDNFLLVGIEHHTEGGVFDQSFLQKFDSLTEKSAELPYITDNQSLTKVKLPVKSAFGIMPIPAIHIEDSSYYAEDRIKVLSDPRFVRNLISEDGKSLVLFLKTKDKINLEESETLMHSLDSLVKSFNFNDYHYLGRANFQKELVWMQKREVFVSTIVAAILVSIIITILFRRWKTVALAMTSIGLSMFLFFGILGIWGRELSAMAALYPVLMVIIGTSDFIHMLSKYIDELRRGHSQDEAIWLTMKEIGLATLMTAVTTAVGFATLVTSRVVPIQQFGVNAAIGVMVAYVTVLLFTTAMFSFFNVNDLILLRGGSTRIEQLMQKVYQVTKLRSRTIGLIAMGVLLVSVYGVSKIKTNYSIEDNMPIGEKVTSDFFFFEKVFAGFRPLEYAVFAQNGLRADDYAVMNAMNRVEEYIKTIPAIRSVTSPTMIYKSINQMTNGNRNEAFLFPSDSSQFADFQIIAEQIPKSASQVLMSKDGTKARIATKVSDLGADSVMAVGNRIDAWIASNIDSNVAKFRRTGTGYIIDKNAMYIRDDLLEGIAWEVGLIALIMGLMLRNARMIVIFLIPNLFPLVFAGALLGYLGIDLDAGISMIFTVVFGISIDDTIHFLSSFNINRKKGQTVDKALHTTLLETGKPVCITTIILFFGFLVMLFSIHPPSVTVGKLIAVTLITALMSDLFINPILIRWWIKDKI